MCAVHSTTQDGSSAGAWEVSTKVVGVRMSTQDIQVTTNDCDATNFRVYGPNDAQVFTAANGKCNETEPQMVLIGPSGGTNGEKQAKKLMLEIA